MRLVDASSGAISYSRSTRKSRTGLRGRVPIYAHVTRRSWPHILRCTSSRDHFKIDATRMHDQINARANTILWVLFAASGLLFVIACSNVANLVLARTVRRESKLAVRSALGADTEPQVGRPDCTAQTQKLLVRCHGWSRRQNTSHLFPRIGGRPRLLYCLRVVNRISKPHFRSHCAEALHSRARNAVPVLSMSRQHFVYVTRIQRHGQSELPTLLHSLLS